MTSLQYIYLYLLTVPVFFIIDMLWLGLIARPFYQKHLEYLLGPVQWLPAIILYLILIIGVIFFAVAPNLAEGSLLRVLAFGALFGFCAYAAYDLTNLATLKEWPLVVTLVDMAWGTFICATVGGASYVIGRALFF